MWRSRGAWVAEGSVRKRIDRLVREQIIQIGAWADLLKVGYLFYINMELHVRLRDIEQSRTSWPRCPRIVFSNSARGGRTSSRAAVLPLE